jgi:hypothetical protein
MNLKQTGHGRVDCSQLAPDKVQRRPLAKAVMNLRVSQKTGEATISFSKEYFAPWS